MTTRRNIPIAPEKRAAILKDLEGVEPIHVIATRHGVNRCTVSSFAARNGFTGRYVEVKQAQRKRPMPDTFPHDAAVMSATELAAKYKCNTGKVAEWRKECGVNLSPDIAQAARREASRKAVQTRWGDRAKPERITVKRPPPRPAASPKRAFEQPQRDMSPTGIAADYLKRFTAVIRCDVNGRPLPDGFFWRYGRVVLTDEQLIERAEEAREREARRAAQYREARA